MGRADADDRHDPVVEDFLMRVAELPAPVTLPDPAVLWCRARLLHRQPDRSRVLRWLTVFAGLEVAACVAAATALFYSSWSTLSRLLWG